MYRTTKPAPTNKESLVTIRAVRGPIKECSIQIAVSFEYIKTHTRNKSTVGKTYKKSPY